jgi:hypothetical protein
MKKRKARNYRKSQKELDAMILKELKKIRGLGSIQDFMRSGH